jgi:hypothetical protein
MRASATRIFQPPDKRAHVAVHHFLAKAQAREDFARPTLQGVAVQFLEAPLHLTVALDDVLHVVRPVRIPHGGLQLLQLDSYGAHRAGAVHHLGHSATARHLAHVLAEIADGNAPIDGHLPLVGLLLARDHPEERRLAGPVGTHEANLLPLLERRGGLDEEDLVAILLADVVETNHMHTGAWKKLQRSGIPMPSSIRLTISCTKALSCAAWLIKTDLLNLPSPLNVRP